MEEALKAFVDIALDRHVLVISGGIYAGFRAAQRSPLATHPTYRRALPVLPECLGVAAALSGGIPIAAGMSIALKVALGLWCAYVAQKFQKILGQTILGDDRVIEKSAAAKIATKESQDLPAPEPNGGDPP